MVSSGLRLKKTQQLTEQGPDQLRYRHKSVLTYINVKAFVLFTIFIKFWIILLFLISNINTVIVVISSD